ncbi:hypothetical protein FRC03_012464 [Tulasnella sp. 419]|nr:hypothetical protein FRC03_012464 [Tulasnella sp. 419]
MAHSGLQREVLHLYRRSLRNAYSKPPATRDKFVLYVHYNFRHPSKGGGVSKRDVSTIEYLIRSWHKTLEMWETGALRDCWVTKDMWEWGQSQKLLRQPR